MRISLYALIASASVAAAEMPPVAGPDLSFDVIFDVPEVQSLTLDSATGDLYAAVSPTEKAGRASDIMRWKLDPIRLEGTWPTGLLVSDLAISPNGLVYAAGQRDIPPGENSTRAPTRSGNVINLDPDNTEKLPVEIIRFTDDGVNAVSRFNQVAFSSEGMVYVASPTQFSVAVRADNQDLVTENVRFSQLVLTCGAPAQLSLFSAGNRTGYVASTTDGALLETGAVDLEKSAYGKQRSVCFRVTNVFGYEKTPSTLNSVVHAVLSDANDRAFGVLALEPNTSTLHLLRLDPDTQQLARADSAALAGPNETLVAGQYNFLASSQDGSIIFVGGRDRESIFRFRHDGERLQLDGHLHVGVGLRSVEISADGTLAALVLRDKSGLDRIHLIHHPERLGDGWQRLPSGGSSLRQVQSELNELGLNVGQADGMLGPRTRSAIEKYLAGDGVGESSENRLQSIIGGVLLTQPDL